MILPDSSVIIELFRKNDKWAFPIFCTIISFLLFSCQNNSHKSPTDYELHNLNGPVHIIHDYIFTDSTENRFGSHHISTFNKSGFITKTESFNDNDSLTEYSIFSYDSKNRLIKHEVFNNSNELVEFKELKYDKGKIEINNVYPGNQDKDYLTIANVDGKGNINRREYYQKNLLFLVEDIEYDSQNRIKKLFKTRDNKLEYEFLYTYIDSTNKEILSIIWHVDNSITDTFWQITISDSMNNPIKQIFQQNNQHDSQVENFAEYDDLGNWTYSISIMNGQYLTSKKRVIEYF